MSHPAVCSTILLLSHAGVRLPALLHATADATITSGSDSSPSPSPAPVTPSPSPSPGPNNTASPSPSPSPSPAPTGPPAPGPSGGGGPPSGGGGSTSKTCAEVWSCAKGTLLGSVVLSDGKGSDALCCQPLSVPQVTVGLQTSGGCDAATNQQVANNVLADMSKTLPPDQAAQLKVQVASCEVSRELLCCTSGRPRNCQS